MNSIKSPGEKAFDIFAACFLVVLAVIFLYPFWDTLMLSFSNTKDAVKRGLRLLPSFPPELEAYRKVFDQKIFFTAFVNSVFRTVVGTVCTTLFTFCGAYVLSKRDLLFRGPITMFIAFTMFFGGGLIPTYLWIHDLKLAGSWLVWILPSLTSAWNLFIARNFLMGIPDTIEEAAMIDGAGVLTTMFRIVFPMSAPVCAVIALWAAVGQWNAWYDAYLYTNNDRQMVLQLLLRRILVDNTADMMDGAMTVSQAATTPATVKAATITVAVIPIACIYPFFQKYFVKGINIGSLKG